MRILFLLLLLPSLILASPHGMNRGRHHLVSQTRNLRRQVHLVPRAALPAKPNAGHRSAKRAIKRSLSKRHSACRVQSSSSAVVEDAVTTAQSTTTWDSFTTVTATSTTEVEVYSQPSSSVDAPESSSTWTPEASAAQNWAIEASTQQSSQATHTTYSTISSTTTTSVAASYTTGTSSSGLLDITDPVCGWCDSSTSEPNGAESWLNCGVTGSGWTPPMVTIEDLNTVELTASGPFTTCQPYFDLFEQYGDQYGLPSILLASIALQESTCNPSETGGNGEAGLMQLASENCGGAPDGNCYDTDFNVQRGAEYFSTLLSQYDNNFLAAMGSYNGWFTGMTVADATAAAAEGDCSAQNNLDYLTQMVNGWMRGIDGYTIGTYQNIASC